MFAVGRISVRGGYSISVRGGFLRRETAREVVYVKSSTRNWSETLKYGINVAVRRLLHLTAGK